jgi:hypothetical protein
MNAFQDFCLQKGASQANKPWFAMLKRAGPTSTPLQGEPTQPNQLDQEPDFDPLHPQPSKNLEPMGAIRFGYNILTQKPPPQRKPGLGEQTLSGAEQFINGLPFLGGYGTKLKENVTQRAVAPVKAQIEAVAKRAKETGNYSELNWYAQRYPEVYERARQEASATAKKWGLGLAAGGLGLMALLPFLWNKDEDEETQQARIPDPRRMASYRLS